MRIYPPVPNPSPREVPSGGDTVLGIHLPGGTVIQFPHFAAYHYFSYFKDAEEFIPERWLGGSEFANDNFAIVQPFSMGPRNCIGKNLAYAEMRLILAKFLFCFDIEVDAKTGTEWTDQKTFVL
jgi:cytochrome P450